MNFSRQQIRTEMRWTVTAFLRTYSMILFSQERWLGILLLCVTFFNPVAGLTGLVSVGLALVIARVSGINAETTGTGLFSFNALFIGIGMGTFYETGIVFCALLFTAVLFSVVLSVTLGGWLGKYGLPFLSIPFVLTFWLVLLSSGSFSQLGLSQRNIYWMNEMYATGGKNLLDAVNAVENIPLPEILKIFFRSLSALFFQGNLLSGICIATGLLFYSRIAFSLAVAGFACAYEFGILSGNTDIQTAYYHLGSNYMMTVIAIGAFFCVPSGRSYLWALWTVAMTALVIAGIEKISATWLLPVFSFPFCIVVILLLYFFRYRVVAGKLQVVLIQHYSPEKNLYMQLNASERLKDSYYFRFSLPFMGEWMVTQGYDGNITHKGDWSKALDFMLLDDEMKTYSGTGANLPDFYCFGKPVLAPADGIIEAIVDSVPDNPVGKVNMEQNWGNTIVIAHAGGLFTKLSHLRFQSIRVKKGDAVKKGDLLAQCGNSGRSPEPHLHFQVQAWPDIASRTIAYPISYFNERNKNGTQSKSFSVPEEGSFVSNTETSQLLAAAFAFQPGYRIRFETARGEEQWESATDAWNRSYLFIPGKNAFAYFVNNQSVFYFTSFYGDEKTLLYRFFVSCYKVPLSVSSSAISDQLPLHYIRQSPLRWLQDLVAPFHLFLARPFRLTYSGIDDPHHPRRMTIESESGSKGLTGYSKRSEAKIRLGNGKIEEFIFTENKKTITARCVA